MLREIYCEDFLQKRLSFHKGLNIIAGDVEGTNSIGKTTMLYIIDYVFGGSSYIKKNDEVLSQIGHHTIYFILEFDKVLYYFSRTTDSELVIKYDEGFENITLNLTLSDYTKFLKQKYRFGEMNESFRNVVTRFSRIYRKGTYNVEEPFAGNEKEARKNSISLLLNLFEMSSNIKDIRKRKEVAETELKTFNSAKKFNFVPTINKMQMIRNNKEIEMLEKQKNQLTQDGQVTALDVKAIVSSEVINLGKEKSKYTIALTAISNEIAKLSSKNEKESQISYSELNDLFPDISIRKVEEIENFHKVLKENLSAEIIEYVNVLESKKRMLVKEIAKCDEELGKISDTKKVPVAILSKYSILDQKINKMKLEIEYYIKGVEISERKNKTSVDYNEAVKSSLEQIEKKLNDGVEEYRRIIDKESENTQFPKIKIESTTYSVDFNIDKGTGTAYSTLINIDLVMLKETKLPYVIEDSIIFKNISNKRMENIIDIYNSIQGKQIFVAFDKINDYGKGFVRIAESNKVLQLSDEKPLFGKKFGIQKSE